MWLFSKTVGKHLFGRAQQSERARAVTSRGSSPVRQRDKTGGEASSSVAPSERKPIQGGDAGRINYYLQQRPGFWAVPANTSRMSDFEYGEGIKHENIDVRLQVIETTDRSLTSEQLDKALEDDDFRMLDSVARHRFQALNSVQKNKLINKVLDGEVRLSASIREVKKDKILSKLLEQGAGFSAEQVNKILDTLHPFYTDDLIKQGLPLTEDQIDIVLARDTDPEPSLIESRVKGKRRAFTEQQFYRLNRDEDHPGMLVRAGHLSEHQARKYATPHGIELLKKKMREEGGKICRAYIRNFRISHEIVREAVINKDDNVRIALIRARKRPLDKKSLEILLRLPNNHKILNELSKYRGKELSEHGLVDVLFNRMVRLNKRPSYEGDKINFRFLMKNKDISLTSDQVGAL